MKNSKPINILLTAFAMCAVTPSLFAQKLALTGKVFSSSDAPISGAKISIFSAETRTLLDRCTTKANGIFTSKRVLDKGQAINVTVTADGFKAFQKDYTVNTGKTGKIVLSPNPKRGENGSGVGMPSDGTPNPRGLSIKGIVGSDQVARVKGVRICFYRQGQEDMADIAETDGAGFYQSKPIFKTGDAIDVVAQKIGFSEQRKTTVLKENQDVTVDFVLVTRTFIAGFVVNSSGQAIQNVQISYQSKESPYLDAVKTNAKGYFDFDVSAAFTAGEKSGISIRAEKEGYIPVTKPHVITVAENQINFVLKLWTEEGIPLGLMARDKKGKAIKGVGISHYDVDSNKIVTKFTQDKIPLLQNIKTEPGKTIDFTISKHGYKTKKYQHRFGPELEYVDIFLEKDRSKCPCWLYTTIGLAAVSATGYGLYADSYDRYKPFQNPDRESDYKSARTRLRIGTVAGGLAIGTFATWLVCKHREKKKNGEGLQGFVPWSPDNAYPGIHIGIAYKF